MSLSKSSLRRLRKALCLLALAVNNSLAYATEPCSLLLASQTIATLQAPPGWRAQTQREIRLYTAGLMAGDPSEGGYLKPARTKLTRSGDTAVVVSVWDLRQPREDAWLFCGYGDAVELYRPVAKDASECVMTSEVRGRAIRKIGLVCR